MLHCFYYDADRIAEAACPQASTDGPPIVWFDMFDPTPEEVARVEAYLGIAIPTRDEMAEIELSDRLYAENGAVFMTMTALSSLDEDEPLKTLIYIRTQGCRCANSIGLPRTWRSSTGRLPKPRWTIQRSGVYSPSPAST